MPQRLAYATASPQTYNALLAFDKVLAHSSVIPSLRHLIKLRASQINGCLFCVDLHTKEALKDGERQLRLIHLPVWHESELFSPKERAALAWTERLTLLAEGEVDAEEVEAMKQHFSDQELSDLSVLIGLINLWNRLGVPFQPVPGSLDAVMGLDKLGLS